LRLLPFLRLVEQAKVAGEGLLPTQTEVVGANGRQVGLAEVEARVAGSTLVAEAGEELELQPLVEAEGREPLG
jgi:hypothetical protein